MQLNDDNNDDMRYNQLKVLWGCMLNVDCDHNQHEYFEGVKGWLQCSGIVGLVVIVRLVEEG